MLQYVFDSFFFIENILSYIFFPRKVSEISLKISENADFLMKAT